MVHDAFGPDGCSRYQHPLPRGHETPDEMRQIKLRVSADEARDFNRR